jgi:hypothetical protein
MKNFYGLSSAVAASLTFVFGGMNAVSAGQSSVEETLMEVGGAWVLESSEIGGKVYTPPEASGLMVFTERYWVIHAANPVFAACEVGNSNLAGNKMTGSIDSYIWINFPPGTENPKVSADPVPYESEVSMAEGRISFEPMPGQIWTIEGDKITVGTPGMLFDVWKRLEPGESQPGEMEKLMQGIFVLESQTLRDGRVVEPPAIKGFFINVDDFFLYHVVKPQAGWGYSQIGAMKVKGQTVDFTGESRVFVHPNVPPENAIHLEPVTHTHELLVEGDTVSFTLEGPGAILTFKPGAMTIAVTSGDPRTVDFTVHLKKIGDL